MTLILKGDLIDPQLKLELALADVSFNLERSRCAFNVKIYAQCGHTGCLINSMFVIDVQTISVQHANPTDATEREKPQAFCAPRPVSTLKPTPTHPKAELGDQGTLAESLRRSTAQLEASGSGPHVSRLVYGFLINLLLLKAPRAWSAKPKADTAPLQ